MWVYACTEDVKIPSLGTDTLQASSAPQEFVNLSVPWIVLLAGLGPLWTLVKLQLILPVPGKRWRLKNGHGCSWNMVQGRHLFQDIMHTCYKTDRKSTDMISCKMFIYLCPEKHTGLLVNMY